MKKTLTTIIILSGIILSASVLAQQSPTQEVSSVPVNDCEGFMNIKDINPNIIVDMRYSTPDNVFKEVLYSQNDCFLRKDVAENLAGIQKKLEEKNLGLKCWDCYRPVSVQKKLWAKYPDPNFVADPYNGGSKHNRGASVDVTIVDSQGKELLMPTAFDDFSEKAGHDYNNLTQEQLNNRQMLKDTMAEGHFQTFKTEWWHYDSTDYKIYPLVDMAFEELENCLRAKK